MTEAAPGKQEISKSTDWRTVTLLALGFGLVGVDRFMISPVFPAIARDLGLNFSDLGIIAGRPVDRLGRGRSFHGAILRTASAAAACSWLPWLRFRS
ncbi:hypothetical protein [Sphingopyxis sp.]|uniref:hypothetical protein n=1 Tax=Sphingopyxis sp. TaxID=1908224 RepID=UPI001D4D0F1C|nr:hypothetical protein [Sphingopyxis sp.]MBW8297177.1 hypothetical protein [Sphingopyxis sp.]